MAHLHDVRDTDTHYIIDPITMAISNANHKKNKLMQGDHNSEVYTFELPKTIEGHEMMLCDKVELHFINNKSDKTAKSSDVYVVKDMHIDEKEQDKIIFTVTLDGKASKYEGSLWIRILFACTKDGVYTYKKWTEIFKDLAVGEGFENKTGVIEENSDLLLEWKHELEEQIANASVSQEQVEQIEKNTQDISELSEQKIDKPSTATVGQIIKVKAIDENGKPTEFEAVNETHYDTRYTEEIDNSFNYTFDGNLEGREYVEVLPNKFYFVKLSDTPLTKEQFVGSSVKKANDQVYSTLGEDNIIDNGSYLDVEGFVSVFEECEHNEIGVMLSTGLWVSYINGAYNFQEHISKTDIQTVERGELKQLDPKYIKDMYYTEIETVPVTRTVSRSLVDKEFTQLLLQNRQTAQYIDNNNNVCTYLQDANSTDGSITWFVETESGLPPFQIKALKSSTDIEVEDTIRFALGVNMQITVNTIKETVHQIDEEYIPDTIARKEDIGDSASLTTTSKEIVGAINELHHKCPELFVVKLIDNKGTYSVDKTIDEIFEAYNAGKNVILLDGMWVHTLYSFMPDIPIMPELYFSSIRVDTFGSFEYSLVTVRMDGSVDFYFNILAFGNPVELKTQNRTIVGAINELNEKINALQS